MLKAAFSTSFVSALALRVVAEHLTSFVSLVLALASRCHFFCVIRTGDEVLPSTRCPGAGVISLVPLDRKSPPLKRFPTGRSAYRSSEIISVVDGAYRRYQLKRKDEGVLYHQTGELYQAASP